MNSICASVGGRQEKQRNDLPGKALLEFPDLSQRGLQPALLGVNPSELLLPPAQIHQLPAPPTHTHIQILKNIHSSTCWLPKEARKLLPGLPYALFWNTSFTPLESDSNYALRLNSNPIFPASSHEQAHLSAFNGHTRGSLTRE